MVLPVLIWVSAAERHGIIASYTNTNTIASGTNFMTLSSPYSSSQGYHDILLSAVRSDSLNTRFINHSLILNEKINSGYAGLDEDNYLGDYAMRWLLHNTNLKWTAFFLSPGPSEHNTSWMTKYKYLKELGWGIAPIFLVNRSTAYKARIS